MLEFLFISVLRRFLIILKIILGHMSGTGLLQHSKLNSIVYYTMIISGLSNFIRIVFWKKNIFYF